MEKFHHEKVKYIKDQKKLWKRNHQNIGEPGKTFIAVFNEMGMTINILRTDLAQPLGQKVLRKR